MAVSSTSGSSSGGVATIDVASVVDQLMKVENKPLDVLNGRIDQQKLVISDLGTIKSKISLFQDALKSFQNPNSYNSVDVTYTDKTVLTASGSNGALLGNFTVKVNKTASADTWTLGGFSSTLDPIVVDANGFNLTVNGVTYNSKTSISGVAPLNSSPTVQDLSNWINSLGIDAAASVIQTTDSSHYVFQIYGLNSGVDNAVTFDGLTSKTPNVQRVQGGSSVTESGTVSFGDLSSGQSITVGGLTLTASSSISAANVAAAFNGLTDGATHGDTGVLGTWSGSLVGWSSATNTGPDLIFTSTTTHKDVADLRVAITSSQISHSTSASDSEIEVNGTRYIRSSNAINDVVDGITFNLFNSSGTTQVVNVSRGSDQSEAVIKKMIDAYNDLISTYKSMTANTYNSDKQGTFAGDPTTLSFINEIKNRFSRGVTFGTAMTTTLSMATIGVDFQLDGTLKFNDLKFMDAKANGLQSKLAQGASVGYISSTNDLKKYIDNLIGLTGGGGSLADVINTETDQINDLYKRQSLLQDKLVKIQNNLVTQYSALNSLLYQLSNTSNALSSALAGLTNNNKNN